MGHGLAVEALRAAGTKRVGIVLNFAPVYGEDPEAVDVADRYHNRYFLDPILGRGYPESPFQDPPPTPNLSRDLELVARPLDFLGVNYYAPVRVAPGTGPLPVRYLPPEGPVTAMGWEVYPKGLYHLLKHLGREVPWPLYITENGAAYPDLWTGEAVVEDPERVAYLEAHVEAAWRALFTLYATATPFDRPWEARYLLEPTGFVPYRLFTRFMRQFAVYTRERYRGGREFYFAGGIEDLARFHGYLRDRNLLTKRLFRPPEGLVAYEVPLLEVPEEAKALLAEVRRRLKAAAYRAPQEERGIVMAQRTLLSRAILERIKLRAALPLVAGLLEEGWHVLLFVQYRSDKTLDLTSPEAVEAFLQDAEERGLKGALHRHLAPALKGLGLTLPSPVAMVREAFGGLGEDLAFYTGAETGSALRRTKAAWDEGRVRLLLATAGKGGVGLSFHDTTGKRPTAQIVLTLPWTATGLDQVLGRVVRLGMKSPVRILFPAAPVPFEQQLAATVAQSLRTLGYAVRGGEGVVPERVVEAFLYDLAAVDLMGFLRLLEAEESLSKAPREEEASSLEVPLPPSG
ncbi:beta-glucosidase [Thermus scotoductus]|uniref:beta-glucosidase n=1 Tax=Thermus scotoductus TaxID=37636 RepID=A0A430SBA8_THESC|nr:beta-glucosidase [Thermus scotoductus]RTH06726.1 beta-glucosidase [Thermus scotoductus]RTH12742.1 beta-glucosidase [Thermus scotoductus]RTH13862.1 beta-glucosidase [Thermus scotoductus]RTH31047.1 beta-glucosidase [Thermus scotoductus]